MGRSLIALVSIIALYITLMALLPTEYGLAVTAGIIVIALIGDDLANKGFLKSFRQRFRQ